MWRVWRTARNQRSVLVRRLSYPREPLTDALQRPRFDTSATVSRDFPQLAETQMTTLENGLKIATQAAFGQYSTVGVFVDAGSRYEVNYPYGMTHFLSKIAMQSSTQFPSKEAMTVELEKCGGVPECQAFRDVTIYAMSGFSFCVPQLVEILANCLWKPQLSEQELEEARQAIMCELEDLAMKPVPEELLMELSHQASYRDNTLGLPRLCPKNAIGNVAVDQLKTFIASHFVPSRMVLVGVNTDHQQMVDLAREHFVRPVTSWEGVASLPVDVSIAQYTGGPKLVAMDGAPVVGPNPLPELTHISLSLECSSFNNKDFYATAVLQSLMGGGGSFSAGGPGKGMHTQLYLNVLSRYHWIYHAQAMSHAYSDSGIFCIFGSAHPSRARDLTEVLCQQFYEMTKQQKASDIERAKKQLQSLLMMNLESRLINFEDIGRQVLGQNRRLSAQELCQLIESVSVEDVQRVAQKMQEQSPLALAALGDLTSVPDVKEVEDALIYSKGVLAKRSRLFSFR